MAQTNMMRFFLGVTRMDMVCMLDILEIKSGLDRYRGEIVYSIY